MSKYYLNPSRRDLVKQLLAMGVVSSSSLLHSTVGYGSENDPAPVLNPNNTTWRKDPKYEALRSSLTWKPNIPERYPDVIVQVKSEEEIIQALAFAKKSNLQVVTRNSGHNIDSLRDAGMLLDMSSMTDFSIDAESMKASIQPALTSYYFYEHLAKQGLIFPVPECLSVSMGGYLLGGGYASMGFYWGDGPACYSIIAADVNLADGRKITASKEENPEIFWAIRGIGPGFFGVVTRFHLQLYPQPEVFMRSTYHYSLEFLEKVLGHLASLKDRKHRQTQISLELLKTPGSSPLPKIKLDVRALGDDEAATRSLLSIYRNIEPPGITSRNEFERVTYDKFMYNPSRSERNLSDNIWTEDRSVFSAVIEHSKKAPVNSTFITTLYNDRQQAPQKEDACHSPLGSHFMSNHLLWDDAANDAENEQWYVGLCNILWPYATAYYVNQMEGTERPERMKKCFTPKNWQRLSELRRKYDPDKRFFAHVGWN